MAGYRLFIKRSAAKELSAVSLQAGRRRLTARIQALATDPRPPGCEKLAGYEDRYRVRQGDYRIVFEIDDGERAVIVFKIGHRREVYR